MSFHKPLILLFLTFLLFSNLSSSAPTDCTKIILIHRHGDRTPITPLLDSKFWSSQLPSEEHISRISSKITVDRGSSETAGTGHKAEGEGCWGKLTTMGLLQMVQLGETFRGIVEDLGLGMDDVR